MGLNVAKKVAALEQMAVNELRQRYAEAFGEQTRVRHKGWLVRRIIWRLQAQAEGDLTERAWRRAAELANDSDLRSMPPKAPGQTVVAPERTKSGTLKQTGNGLPPPGSVITREYKGRTLQVFDSTFRREPVSSVSVLSATCRQPYNSAGRASPVPSSSAVFNPFSPATFF